MHMLRVLAWLALLPILGGCVRPDPITFKIDGYNERLRGDRAALDAAQLAVDPAALRFGPWPTRADALVRALTPAHPEAASLVQTNLAFEDILSLVPIAANLDPSRIEQFNVLRLYHTTPWQTPDGDYVQLPVYDTLRPMLEDFYTPPTENQLTAAAARIAIFNASGHPRWDEVAAARLTQEGFAALPMGEAAEPVAQTRLVDYTGRTKGSSIEQIARALNLTPQQLALEPSATRDYDYVVTLGADYDSCTRPGVMDVNVAEAAPGG